MANYKVARTPCRNCLKAPASRLWRRGLCWPCYQTPGVRTKFPVNEKVKRRGVMNGFLTPPLPPEPTSAVPGSEAKVEVMRARAEAGYCIFHPGDATLEGVRGGCGRDVPLGHPKIPPLPFEPRIRNAGTTGRVNKRQPEVTRMIVERW